MIPKVIHYCWFGGKPLPELALKCIESWKKYCPEYDIVEWNENNFSLNCCEYVKEAVKAGKWAFVSDYARFKILFEHGGVYFDTDVEVIKPIDDIIEKGPFFGLEQPLNPFEHFCKAAPGLGMASEMHSELIREILQIYSNEHYIMEDGSFNRKTILDYTTEILCRYGYDGKNIIQNIEGFIIYPTDYFCPMNYSSGKINITKNTRTIHHYAMSWKSEYEVRKKKLERKCKTAFGDTFGLFVFKIISVPIKVIHKINLIIKEKK